jgi:hypothetical protein
MSQSTQTATRRWTVARMLPLAGLLLCPAGCSLVQRTAIGTMIPIFDNTLSAAYRNGDVDLVEEGLPANLILTDGLIETRPKDRRLLILGSQLYFSYAAGFVEERNPERAADLYLRALEYGLRAFPELREAQSPGQEGLLALESTVSDLDSGDVPGLLWLAGSWAGWIELNLSKPRAMAQIPNVERLAERIVELDGTFMHGMPYVLLGTILALRPEPVGGNPERAREMFDAGFAVADRRFLVVHLYFARYYCRQIFDDTLFDSTIAELSAADPAALPDALLLNRVAQRRGRHLAEIREELF